MEPMETAGRKGRVKAARKGFLWSRTLLLGRLCLLPNGSNNGGGGGNVRFHKALKHTETGQTVQF